MALVISQIKHKQKAVLSQLFARQSRDAICYLPHHYSTRNYGKIPLQPSSKYSRLG